MIRKIFNKLGTYFITGIVVAAPTLITLILMIWAFNKLDRILGGIFDMIFGMRIPGVGLLALILIILIIGFLAQYYFGRKLLSVTDAIFSRLPVAKSVYGAVKQIQELVSGKKKLIFQKVVLIEFPRKECWSIAFLVSEIPVEMNGKQLFPIFFATTPNPTSGFLLYLDRKDFIVLDVTIEDAMKMIISAGMIAPQSRDKNFNCPTETNG
jgi:uncharacterized membrane protein